MMIRWSKRILPLVVVCVLFVILPMAEAAQPQDHIVTPVQKIQPIPINMMFPVKISFDITHGDNFWSAVLSKNGGLSWAGLPANITIRVLAGNCPTYSVYNFTTLPLVIDTGNLKFPQGSEVAIKVEITSMSGERIADKTYTVPANGVVFNITLQGPAQPVVYKPVIIP